MGWSVSTETSWGSGHCCRCIGIGVFSAFRVHGISQDEVSERGLLLALTGSHVFSLGDPDVFGN